MRAQADPLEAVFTLAQGFEISQGIYVAINLRIADHLSEGPQDVATLAALTGAHPGVLYRILRMLASVGVFREEEGQVFHQNELSEYLRLDVSPPARTVANHVLMRMRPEAWQAWGELLYSAKTGQGGFPHLFGGTVFDRNSQDADENKLFNRAMTSHGPSQDNAILDAYDFGQFSTVVDVGGSRGSFLFHLLRKHPHIRGTLFDLPHVVAGVEGSLDADLKGRCRVVGGSFFEEIPAGADAYIFKLVIHNWNDEKAAQILATCRQAIPDHGKILIIGADMGEANTNPASKLMDLNMLVMFDAKERTAAEHEELFRATGFRLGETKPALGSFPRLHVVEGIPL